MYCSLQLLSPNDVQLQPDSCFHTLAKALSSLLYSADAFFHTTTQLFHRTQHTRFHTFFSMHIGINANTRHNMVLHSSQNADQPFSQCSVDLASPDAGPPRARSCLRRPQVLGGPCLALQLLWPSSRMHARVSLTIGDGSHDPARCSDRDRAPRASPSSMYLGRCD